MKKLLALLALVLGVVSCQTEPEGLDVNVGGEIDAIVNVTIPEVETRAGGNNSALGVFNNGVLERDSTTMRYILQVYYKNGEQYVKSTERLVKYSDGTSVAFDVRLVPQRNYQFVVWADVVTNGENDTDNHYITEDLANITLNNTWVAMDESRDAFTATVAVDNYSSSSNITVKLKRPFAKLRVITTDMVALNNLDITPVSAKVTYQAFSHESFNALNGTYSDIKIEQTHTYAISNYADQSDANKVLFTDYFFAGDSDVVKFQLDVYESDVENQSDNTLIKHNDFTTDIPVQRNHLTTIKGNILTDGNNVEVKIVDGFDGEIEETYPPASIDSNRVIRYTATEEVVPYNADAFGANIVSNTYENGQGVITFDASVTSIGDLAFTSCSSLTSITIPESVDSIGGAAFAYCRSLTSITIPDSVTSIGKQAFAYTSLTSVTIPDSVTSIGSSAFDGCTSLTSITIPDSVTSIGDFAFDSCHSLTSVTIPDSVISIGSSAFDGCTSLTSVTIPDSVISIGEYAFFGCTSLTSITIGNGVTSIGEAAFYECTKLTSVAIPNSVTSIGSYAFYGCTSLASVTIPDSVISIGDYAFWRCTSLTSVTIGNSVTSIGEYAFCACYSLTSVTIPNSVTSIGVGAFYGCTSLTSVYCKATTPPTGSSNMFDMNASGRKIYVPRESVEAYKAASGWSNYADYIFEEAETKPANNEIWYTSSDGSIITPNKSDAFGANIVSNTYENGQGVITFDAPVTSIGGSAFYDCTSLTSITIPDSVTSIGNLAFRECTSLTSVTIPDSVTSIGDDAFRDCTSLASVTIPDRVTSIGRSAFEGCTSLTSVTIGNSVTSIGEYAFCACYSLTSVTIPNSVTSIGVGAFYGCTSLTSVYCKATTPPTGSSNMFDMNASGRKIYVPRESVEAYKAASGWSNYADYIFEEAETKPANNEIWYTSSDGSIITPNKSDAFGANIVSNTYENGQGVITFDAPVTSIGYGAFYECTSLTSVIIGNSVTSIGKNAFYNCTSLKSVTIGNSVTSIGDQAFAYTSLTSVTIGNGVTSIGQYAFYGCTSLTSVTIPDSVTSIGYAAFADCYSLKAFYGKFASADNRCLIVDGVLNSFANGCGATEYTIPNSVTSIGEGAFDGCKSLTSVTIPNSVTSIGNYAFWECTSLASVTIPDRVTSIGEEAFYDCTSLTSVYCKATTPPTGGPNMFDSNASDRKIYVPRNSVEAYQSASYWNEYASYIEGYDF